MFHNIKISAISFRKYCLNWKIPPSKKMLKCNEGIWEYGEMVDSVGTPLQRFGWFTTRLMHVLTIFSRDQHRACGGRRYRSQEASVRHLGQCGQRGLEDGLHWNHRKDSGQAGCGSGVI